MKRHCKWAEEEKPLIEKVTRTIIAHKKYAYFYLEDVAQAVERLKEEYSAQLIEDNAKLKFLLKKIFGDLGGKDEK